MSLEKARAQVESSLNSLDGSIKEFKTFRLDLEENKNFMREKQKELALNSQLIKKEVFDLADTMDILAQVIRSNYTKITQLSDTLLVPEDQSKSLKSENKSLPSTNEFK